jgi:hypothetical protein
MAEREDLLVKLVLESHLNVADRQKLGVVYRQEIAEIVKVQVRQRGVFPDHRGSRAVYEGATLALVPAGVEITRERSCPLDPYAVAERHTKAFEELDVAVEEFIDSEWPAGIDGVKLHQ